MIKHLACIMDGNRRWAQKQDMASSQGHFEGVKTAERVMAFCRKKGIAHLSLYLFSLENFNRSAQEKHFLFYELLVLKADEFTRECIKNDIRICFVGDRSQFPPAVIDTCDAIAHKTEQCSSLAVDLLFCYGGQQEIVAVAQLLAQQVKEGSIAPSDITVDLFRQSLWSAPTPPPDVILRTGGMHRLSNFLLFQSAYAEIMVVDTLWPDVDDTLLEQVLEKFEKTKRNFGV